MAVLLKRYNVIAIVSFELKALASGAASSIETVKLLVAGFGDADILRPHPCTITGHLNVPV